MSHETLGFNIWTKNMPQPYLELYADYARQQRLPLLAIVDDILPSVRFGRSEQQDAAYANSYVSHMTDIGFQRVALVSELLPERSSDLTRVYDMSERIGLAAFLALLPEHKRSTVADLTLAEAVDTCWQLCVLEAGITYTGITRYLTGKRSTALFRYAKKVIGGFDFDIIEI